jgi:epsilon-lactone hydrolase
VTSRPSYRRVIEARRSWRSYALNALLRLMRGRLAPDADIVALRRYYERLDARQFSVDRAVGRTPVDCGGVIGEWIAVAETRHERVILYLHGGSFAFRFPNAYAALAARLCRRLNARALLPDYRLAPEHPFRRRRTTATPRIAGCSRPGSTRSRSCSPATRPAATWRW